MSLTPQNIRKKYGLTTSSSALRLSSNTLERYHTTFKSFEYPENSGTIGVEKLQKLFNSLGTELVNEKDIDLFGDKLTKEELEEILAHEPKKEGLSFESFCKIMAARLSEDERDTELREVFNAFDQNRDGRISVDELQESVEQILDEKIDDIEELLGIPKGGSPATREITFEQFKQLMNSAK